jgi:glucose/arabinose dehydrogenase
MQSALLNIATLFLVWAVAAPTEAQAPRSPTPKPADAPVRTTTVAKGLDHPWGSTFLPDGRILVTERSGSLRIAEKDGRVSEPVAGVPKVRAGGQGGLLDVALSPNFEKDRLVYLSYSEPGEAEGERRSPVHSLGRARSKI